MVDRHVVSSRLSALDGYLAELRAFQDRSREEFIASPGLHHLAERYLHLACECVLDIAQHVISDLGLRQAEGYKDSIAVLGEEGILETELAEALERWMGLRKVLVHLYLKIDHGRIYDAIVSGTEDLKRFADRMGRFLEDGPGD